MSHIERYLGMARYAPRAALGAPQAWAASVWEGVYSCQGGGEFGLGESGRAAITHGSDVQGPAWARGAACAVAALCVCVVPVAGSEGFFCVSPMFGTAEGPQSTGSLAVTYASLHP